MTRSLKTVGEFQNMMFPGTRKRANVYTRTRMLINMAARIARDEFVEDQDDDSSSGDFDLLWTSLDQKEDKVADSNVLPESSHVKKSLTFLDDVEEYDYISLSDYSEREVRKCWYTADEKKRSRDKVNKIVARMEQGDLSKESIAYQCLQSWTREGSNRLKNNVMCVVNAVMDEQDRQWAGNYTDDFQIAALSRDASVMCRVIARQIAMKVEREAQAMRTKGYASKKESSSACLTDDERSSKTSKSTSHFKKCKKTRRRSLTGTELRF